MGKSLKRPPTGNVALDSITAKYPDLRISSVGPNITIEGILPVIVEGEIVDRFQIRIDAKEDYPKEQPLLWEEGGRIPKVPERHFSKDLSACYCLRDEWGWIKERCPDLLKLIDGPISDFFLWQVSYDFLGENRMGEWAHEAAGRLQFYQQLFQTDDLETIERGLLHLVAQKYRPNARCFCGSNKRAAHCHGAKILLLRRKIPAQLAKTAWIDIIAATKHGDNVEAK